MATANVTSEAQKETPRARRGGKRKLITREMADRAVAAFERRRAASRLSAEAHADADVELLRVAEIALGVMSLDALRRLSPEEVEARFSANLGASFTFEKGAALRLKLVREARFPGWREELARLAGEARALELQRETPVSYAYAVVRD